MSEFTPKQQEQLKTLLEEYVLNLEGLKLKVKEWKNDMRLSSKMSFTRLEYMITWGEQIKEILEEKS